MPSPEGVPRPAREAGTSARATGPPRLAQTPFGLGHRRTSPARPSSPKATTSGGTATPRNDGRHRQPTPRSAAGSLTARPPTAATKKSDRWGAPGPVRHASKATQQVGPSRVEPQGVGHVEAEPVGARAGPAPRRGGAATLHDRHHDAAGDAGHAVAQHERPGSGTGRRPSSRISKIPTSPAGPKRSSRRSARARRGDGRRRRRARCRPGARPPVAAGSPSFVMWPTTRKGTPLDLARRVRRSTQAGTCATLRRAAPRRSDTTGASRRPRARGAGLGRRLDRLDVGALEREQVGRHRPSRGRLPHPGGQRTPPPRRAARRTPLRGEPSRAPGRAASTCRCPAGRRQG